VGDLSTAATFAPVEMIAPMVAASAVTRPAATVRTTVVPPWAVRTLSTGAFAGSRSPSWATTSVTCPATGLCRM
jgi:hypothetical protein